MNAKVLFSSKSDEYITPSNIYNYLDHIFHFDLDACATQFNTKCKNYYTLSDNALIQEWNFNSIFCNPPYSKIKLFVKKAYESYMKYNNEIVLLIPSRTDTQYFHNYIFDKSYLVFIKGRLKFGTKNTAPFPSVIVIYSKYFPKGSYCVLDHNKGVLK